MLQEWVASLCITNDERKMLAQVLLQFCWGLEAVVQSLSSLRYLKCCNETRASLFISISPMISSDDFELLVQLNQNWLQK